MEGDKLFVPGQKVGDKSRKLKVHFAPADQGGTSYHWMHLPAKIINSTGIAEAVVDRLFDMDSDVLILQRQNNPALIPTIQFYQKKGGVVFYWIEDQTWLLPFTSPVRREYTAEVQGRMGKIIAACDGIVCSSQPLADFLSRYNKNAHVLPHMMLSEWATKYTPEVPRTDDTIRILWTTTAHHHHDFNIIEQALKDVCNKYPNVRIVLWGYATKRIMELLPWQQLEYYGWVPIEQYYHCLASMEADIGIAPLDIDSTYNKAKCVVGDTRIITDEGICGIKEVGNDAFVYNGDRLVPISEKVFNGVRKTVKITTSCGYSVEGGMEEHAILGRNGAWKRMKSLRVGDHVVIAPFEFPHIPYPEIRFPLLSRSKDWSSLSSAPIIRFDDNWGKLLGYILGDGYFSNRDTNITCSKRLFPKVYEDIRATIKAVGMAPVEKVKSDRRYKHKRCESISLKGVDFRQFLEYIGFSGKYRKQFRVPRIIFKSPKSVVVAFLRALFECDGTVYGTTCKITSKSKELIEDVQFLLLGFSIKSTIRIYYNNRMGKNYYSLILGRQASEVFEREIGFISDKKVLRLNSMTSKSHSGAYKEWQWEDEVVKMEHGEQELFDVLIPDGHIYHSNGFISHNTPLKFIEYGLMNIAPVVSDILPYDCVVDGETGLKITKNRHKGWVDALCKLIEDVSLRKTLAEGAHDYVMKNHTEQNIGDFIKIYKETFDVKKAKEAEDKQDA